ncbi:MAG TPA: hypothetical protein VHZ76_00720 [Gammaproteobacteria bacterium]|jgi:hypothetical protein|nr:hypothetical protein [Gammaproteobacteria bacterium]
MFEDDSKKPTYVQCKFFGQKPPIPDEVSMKEAWERHRQYYVENGIKRSPTVPTFDPSQLGVYFGK